MSRALLLASFTAGAFLALGLLGAFGGAAVPAPAAHGVHLAAQVPTGPAPGGLGGMTIAPPANCQLPTMLLQLQPPQVVLGQTSMLQVVLVNNPLFGHAAFAPCVGTVSYEFAGPLVPGGHILSANPMLALGTTPVGPGAFQTTVTVFLSHASGISAITQSATLVVLP